jgi:hypothetical protein
VRAVDAVRAFALCLKINQSKKPKLKYLAISLDYGKR